MTRSAGPIDLKTIEGIDRACDVAIAEGDRDGLNRLLALRRSMVGRPQTAGKSDLVREMERMSAGCRAIASAADRTKIDALLGNRSAPRCAQPTGFKCPVCGDWFDESQDCFDEWDCPYCSAC